MRTGQDASSDHPTGNDSTINHPTATGDFTGDDPTGIGDDPTGGDDECRFKGLYIGACITSSLTQFLHSQVFGFCSSDGTMQ